MLPSQSAGSFHNHVNTLQMRPDLVELSETLFAHALRRGMWQRLWGWLSGRNKRVRCLRDDHAPRPASQGLPQLRTVPLASIRGSEGRCEDFDAAFHPLRSYQRSRWVGLCRAWLAGVTLPPVELIQIGDLYYVRDGHHRVSIARALGREHLDAEVVVWDEERALHARRL